MASSSYITMWAYPWDLVDAGVDETLGFLHNEVGLTAVSVAVAYHSVQQLRPHARASPTWNASRSAIYFQPTERLWLDSPLRPRISPAMGDGDWLADIVQGCRRKQLTLTAWTVCFHNEWLTERYPEAAVCNVFGDGSAARLCPASPASRAYMVALVRDLRHTYAVDAIELESLEWGGWVHGRHPKIGVAIDALDDWLLSLCFCVPCVKNGQRHGVDVEALRTDIQARLRGTFASGESPARASTDPIVTFVASQPELARYLEAREDALLELLGVLRRASDASLHLLSFGDRLASGIDRGRIAELVDRIEILAYSASAGEVGAATRAALKTVGDPGRLVVGLSGARDYAPDAATLARNVKAARDLGVRSFSFYNYGMIPRPHFTWIADALR